MIEPQCDWVNAFNGETIFNDILGNALGLVQTYAPFFIIAGIIFLAATYFVRARKKAFPLIFGGIAVVLFLGGALGIVQNIGSAGPC